MAKHDDIDLAALPSHNHITLLLKHHRSTTLLSVLPNTTFDGVKLLLLAALRSRNITTLPSSDTPLPSSPSQIELGVLADKKDHSKGWVPLYTRLKEVSTGDGGGGGGKRKMGGKHSVFNESVQGARLGDGSWVAWRVRTAREAEGDGQEDDEEEMDDEEDPGWNVVLPSYEEEVAEG